MKKSRSRYIHERMESPVTAARHGKTKYRSIVTPHGDVIRIAFPRGRRRTGSGEVQAILHKKNPLTRSETINVRREAEIHRRIKGSPVKSAYYQGMANGMIDIADEYGIPGRRRENPPPVEIYDCVKEIIARKGPGHQCDAACRRANHMYRHVFKSHAGIYGNADGSLTIRSKK